MKIKVIARLIKSQRRKMRHSDRKTDGDGKKGDV